MCYEKIKQTVTKVLIKYTDSGVQDEYLDAMMLSYFNKVPPPPNVSNVGRDVTFSCNFTKKLVRLFQIVSLACHLRRR